MRTETVSRALVFMTAYVFGVVAGGYVSVAGEKRAKRPVTYHTVLYSTCTVSCVKTMAEKCHRYSIMPVGAASFT